MEVKRGLSLWSFVINNILFKHPHPHNASYGRILDGDRPVKSGKCTLKNKSVEPRSRQQIE
ncbi:hypothetical protein [Nostoc sp. NMS4]|uniref:hypothetical protein n=1 Tax=Nostoc sp. NMS4 TaxID=2815390 RepID=UPI0025DCEB82|nr:hypothetical protein [Nostoc sp. NMS4]MBN3924644.1 hypothetical protein [Nostoc sp. NMS4]